MYNTYIVTGSCDHLTRSDAVGQGPGKMPFARRGGRAQNREITAVPVQRNQPLINFVTTCTGNFVQGERPEAKRPPPTALERTFHWLQGPPTFFSGSVSSNRN